MLERNPKLQYANLIDFAAIGGELDNIASNFEDYEGYNADYFAQALQRDILPKPIGGLLLEATNLLVCERTAAYGQGTIFIYGFMIMYEAIDGVDRELKSKIDEYSLLPKNANPTRLNKWNDTSLGSSPVLEDRPKLAEQIISDSRNGYTKLNQEAAGYLDEIAVMVTKSCELRPFFHDGAGWLAHLALASIS